MNYILPKVPVWLQIGRRAPSDCAGRAAVLTGIGVRGGGRFFTSVPACRERAREQKGAPPPPQPRKHRNRKSTRLNSNHPLKSYSGFCFEKKKKQRSMEA